MTITVLNSSFEEVKVIKDVNSVSVHNDTVLYYPVGVFPEDISFDEPFPYRIDLKKGQVVRMN